MAERTSVRILQIEAAKRSKTIGSFMAFFQAIVYSAMNAGRLIERGEDARAHVAMIAEAVRGHAAVVLDATPKGVLGYNRIGAGDGGMRISRQTLATMGDGADAQSLEQTIAHESAHGKQVRLHGTLELDGSAIDHLLLYEGHAEIAGNEAIGKGISHHRSGQPEAVYGEGQSAALQIIRRAGRAAFERALTSDGDLSRLQSKMDAGNPADQRYAMAG